MGPKPKITLYVDIVSPFGYMAYYLCRHSPIFRQCEITYVPLFLGGLMKTCNNRAPIEIKNKDKWINTERLRWATLFNIPLIQSTPPGFPPLTLATQRALCALQLSHPQLLIPALDALYNSFWVQGDPNIGKAESFSKTLASALGEQVAQDVVGRMGSAEAKAKLAENTDQAFRSGAFGIPWFECTTVDGKTEGFWGFDHLGQVVRFLGLEGQLELDDKDRADGGKGREKKGLRVML